jgi:hypothetical protein
MTMIPAMLSLACERHGPFAEGEKLEQAFQGKRRVLGYGE